MKLTVKSIHFDITDKLNDFISKKADKFAKKSDEITEINVTLKVIKPETSNNKEASIKVLGTPEELFASKVADSFEEAIDLTFDALKGQIEKVKSKK